MALSPNHRTESLYFYLGENLINNEGCLFLSKANWPCLKDIFLVHNQIECEGIKHLSRAAWPLLEVIYLCKIVEILS